MSVAVPVCPSTTCRVRKPLQRKLVLVKKKKKKGQFGSSFFPQILATPLPLEEKIAKEASCPRFTSCNQRESDPWCCVNREDIAISSSPLARLQGTFLPPPTCPLPGVWGGLSGSWNNGTKRPGEVAGTCLTEIAAVMNQASETPSTSSLHKYP